MSLPTPYYDDAESGITIYCGDCREILPHLHPVEIALTDPPYEEEAHTRQRRVLRGAVLSMEPLHFAPMDAALRSSVATMVSAIARSWVLTFCQIEAAMTWRNAYESAGLIYRRSCIWVKPDGMPQYSGDRPGMGYETIVAMHPRGRSVWNGGGRHGVFVFNKNDGAGASPHPTQKPTPLIVELVKLFSNAGDTVLDPFMGSGTTLVAAKQLGRRAIGIEIEERYCAIAVERLRQTVLRFEVPKREPEQAPLLGED